MPGEKDTKIIAKATREPKSCGYKFLKKNYFVIILAGNQKLGVKSRLHV